MPISTESTSVITGESTTITSTIIPVTTTTNVNVIIGTTEISVGLSEFDIIILCTVIPILWFAFIISYFYIRRSKNIIGGILHPFNNISRAGKTWDSYELTNILDT